MTLQEFKADLLRRFPRGPFMYYMAVDGNGYVYQYEFKPKMYTDQRQWYSSSGVTKYKGVVDLPSNIDWRDTLIFIPENTQP